MTHPVLQFSPFSSAVDAAFWQALAQRKLEVLKLSNAVQTVHSYYQTGQTIGDTKGQLIPMPTRLCVPAHGLEVETRNKPLGSLSVTGTLYNANTFEEFQTMDKNTFFQDKANKIWDAIRHSDHVEEALGQFALITFADLKKYKFYYWFAFPALMPQPEPWIMKQPMQPINTIFTQDQLLNLGRKYASFRENHDGRYFLVRRRNSNVCLAPLKEWDDFFNKQDEIIVGFADPSNVDVPGWPLRNLLALVHTRWGLGEIKVLCYRETPGKPDTVDLSRILVAELPIASHYTQHDNGVKAVGWERNPKGKLGPRMADLGPLMDPIRLADTAVDLNLKLMRWRLMPDLDLDKIKNNKCLLLGAGTLGCYVARCLLGWGIRHITFVDNGLVSFSNPVRQPLYTYEDCLNGGMVKAKAAAENLKRVQPSLNTVGYNLSIPMPGHTVSSDEQLIQDIETLTGLIESHDTVFLLTDSRESRWFPTMLAAKFNKMVINAALGFDTYLVMRHGSRASQSSLGCYFCNDIVAPTDSLTDRTLDQQCTVTRPGLAAIAGALATELMVSLLQHSDGINAAADTASQSDGGSILGLVPHQIRGFLGQFSNLLIVGQAYERCTACSDKVTDAYTSNPLEFMKRVLDNPLYLEELTGLLQLKAESEALLLEDNWAESGDEDY